MSRPALHQFLAAALPGDAITDYALLLQKWLQEMGYSSHVYADRIDPRCADWARPFDSYRPGSREPLIIYHHGTGCDLAEQLVRLRPELILIYHNITPPEFFAGLDPMVTHQLARGRSQLIRLRRRTRLALGVSAYNEWELQETGFDNTGLLPLTLDPARYEEPPDTAFVADFQTADPLLLFVGRLVPNKRQEDLIKMLYYLRQRRPAAQLMLIGDPWFTAYANWLAALANDLGLGDAVHLTGHVSQQTLVTAYRRADLYLSMSEHEGVGKPLLESMYLGLPVVAYAAAGVPETLGGAGILFHQKHYPALAELVDLLLDDPALREKLTAGGRARVAHFSEDAVRQQWHSHLNSLTTPQRGDSPPQVGQLDKNI